MNKLINPNFNASLKAIDLAIVQTTLKNLLPQNTKVWIFGSRAKCTATRASDLDLAIDVGRMLTKNEKSALFHAFEESDLSYKVDIVDINNITTNFKKIIDIHKVALPGFNDDKKL